MIEPTAVVLLVDLVIGITLIEGAALVLYHRATGRGLAPHEFVLNLMSGLFLMLALRCRAVDADMGWIVMCLAAAGVAHVTDLWRRVRRDARATAATQECAA